jgi:hypothetical protein
MASTEHGEGGPSYDLPLLPQHRRLLVDSAIHPAVAQARGYRSVERRAELRRQGFPNSSVPALLIPIYGVTGTRDLYQLRPDEPRMINGRVVKYETPRGSRMVLDVPPTVREHLGDPAVPLLITEGVRKADAAASINLCCVDLLGVWNWRGTNAHGGKVALPEFEAIALNDREVYVAFDSDVMVKSSVHLALTRLAEFLATRGAHLRYIYFEPGPRGAKVGLDDFLAQQKSAGDLFALATTTLRRCVGDDDAAATTIWPYLETPGGFIYMRPTGFGETKTPLTNFTATIVREIVEDDGTEDVPHRVFEIEARIAGQPHRFPVPASHFAGMTWVTEHLGSAAILYAGPGTKDHARTAIQLLSRGAPTHIRFVHTGWHTVAGAPMYLHAAGAIGATGLIPDIETALPPALARFALPVPPTGAALVAGVRASLALFGLGPPPVMAPLYAAIWRAALASADFGLHLVGPTGAFKTALAVLAQAHWGAGLDAKHLPATWATTPNALEAIMFSAKDALLLVDDFAPGGTPIDQARAHRDAERVFRAQGNAAGRQRMRADTSLRPPKPPRGLVLSTGEEIPHGQSVRARAPVLELSPDQVDADALTRCQADAAAGHYAAALAGFVQWVAGRYDEVVASLATRDMRVSNGVSNDFSAESEGDCGVSQSVDTLDTNIARIRELATRSYAHRRMPEVVANLALGIGWFFLFAYEIGALTLDEIEERWRAVWAALGEMTGRQREHQAAAEPTACFLDVLRGALVSGHAHVADKHGREPTTPAVWGWRARTFGVGKNERTDWAPQGDCVGWVDGDALYLHAAAAYTAVQRFGRAGGETLSVSVHTLKKRLFEKELLLTTDTRGGKQRFEIRHTLAGAQRTVLHLSASLSLGEERGQVAKNEHNAQESADISWASLWKSLARRGQEWPHDDPGGPCDGPHTEDERPTSADQGGGGDDDEEMVEWRR